MTEEQQKEVEENWQPRPGLAEPHTRWVRRQERLQQDMMPSQLMENGIRDGGSQRINAASSTWPRALFLRNLFDEMCPSTAAGCVG